MVGEVGAVSSLKMNTDCKCSKYEGALKNYADVKVRSEHTHEIEKSLKVIEQHPSEWSSLMQCAVCQSLWVKEYPCGEYHGGGPVCLYQIKSKAEYSPIAQLTSRFRRAAEDLDLFRKLGAEVGPAFCQHSGCSNKKIQFSVMCRKHHIQMITGREFSA